MKIDVRMGDVQVRKVECFGHSRGIYTIEFTAPFDRAISVTDYAEAESRQSGLAFVLTVWAPSRDTPTAIRLIPQNQTEVSALMNIVLVDIRPRPVHCVLAFPSGSLDRRDGVVASWELPSARVDYLESQY